VQLSRVVSENIHETERNLGLVFDEAEGHEPILFFDEADALFNNKSEDDKTKLVNYFLGKAEDYRSTIILSLAQAKTLNPNLLKKFREVLEIK
jgi:SpoVK/Ycf46/Vps4 family AAA+-type ATPase